ncbi:MAG: CBS domain-containing protein [Thermodesulfovibrionales bacterium]|nr:CBS domain-containing protein [Thermodesulfovibrionales bacterium]
MKVEDIMNKNIVAMSANSKIADIMKQMAIHQIRSVLITPKDNTDSFGVVSVRDIVFKVLAKGLDPKTVEASEIVTKPVICIKKDMPINHLLSMMKSYNIARVFVAEEGTIVGIVALMDFVRGYLKKDKEA